MPEYLLDEVEEHLPRLSKFLNKTKKEVKKELANLLEGIKNPFNEKYFKRE